MLKSVIITKKEPRFNKKTRGIATVLATTLLVLGGGWLLFQSNDIPERTFTRAPHFYDNPEIPIATVALTLLYVVPKDETLRISEDQVSNWVSLLDVEKALSEIIRFHELQLEGSSRIVWRAVPRAIIGARTSAEYSDRGDTSGGNPAALLALREELTVRVQHSDIRLPEFAEPLSDDAFPVFVIIFEGVGGVGDQSGGWALLASCYFAKPQQCPNGETVLWHELGHALGIPDAYDHSVPGPVYILGEDIMGAGRERPLHNTFLSETVKQRMGL